MTHKSRTDWLRVFKLCIKIDRLTLHAQQLLKDKISTVKVTKSRDVSADKNAIILALYEHINFKLGGNYRRGGRRVWYTF